jgi:hypothetical protein
MDDERDRELTRMDTLARSLVAQAVPGRLLWGYVDAAAQTVQDV